MKNSLASILWSHRIARIFLVFLGLIGLYLLLAFFGTIIPAGGQAISAEGDVLVFIQTNGVHTDWVVPIHYQGQDWLKYLDPQTFQKYSTHQYMAFGWGDIGFYRESRTGISISTAFKALFYPTQSLMHVKIYKSIPLPSPTRVAFRLSNIQYRALIDFIRGQFIRDSKGYFVLIEPGYGRYDYFFESKDSYHLFNTCNNWTNRGMQQAGVQCGLWTPFSQGVFYWLKE